MLSENSWNEQLCNLRCSNICGGGLEINGLASWVGRQPQQSNPCHFLFSVVLSWNRLTLPPKHDLEYPRVGVVLDFSYLLPCFVGTCHMFGCISWHPETSWAKRNTLTTSHTSCLLRDVLLLEYRDDRVRSPSLMLPECIISPDWKACCFNW